MFCFFAFLVVVSLLTNALEPFTPTAQEIKRAFSLVPYDSWGQQARQENSVRIVCIGGSNTVMDNDPRTNFTSYVFELHKFVKLQNYSHSSYVIQRGQSGMSPDHFIGIHCFEAMSTHFKHLLLRQTFRL
jgi:hypothetical protein